MYPNRMSICKSPTLDKEWSVLLFKCGYRTVSLTLVGKIMYETVIRAMSDFENALELVRHTGNMPCIPVCVGVPEGGFLGNLTALLSEFQSDHPEVTLLLESVPVAQLMLSRSNGKYDMVINQSVIVQNHDDLKFFYFIGIHYTFVISRDYPMLQENVNLTVTDLNGLTLALTLPTDPPSF